jgi:hypothetical protein
MAPNRTMRSVLVQTFLPNWLARKVEEIMAKIIIETVATLFLKALPELVHSITC